MRGPHVRFCERRDGAIHRAYSTQQVFSAASAEEAADFDRFPAALGSDPSGGGCGDGGGFAWTKLVAESS